MPSLIDRRTILVVAFVALIAVACGGGSDDEASVTPGLTTGADSVSGAVACSPALAHDAGSFPDETITTTDGLEREYILHVPPSYTGSERVPLVLNFHGFGLTDDLYAQYTGLDAKADEAGFILVTPQGMTTEAVSPPHWYLGVPVEGEPDDIAFAGELLDALEAELCVDTARVYSAGFSNGAAFSVRLACALPERIAAIAPVSGVFAPGDGDCPAPLPVIAFHGTADALVPFEGGSGGPFGRGSIDGDIIPAWAEHNGCTSQVDENPVTGTAGVRLVRNEGCDGDATVELYVIEDADPNTQGEQGGGHSWPGATFGEPDDANNPTSQEISANDLIWDFFAAHPLH